MNASGPSSIDPTAEPSAEPSAEWDTVDGATAAVAAFRSDLDRLLAEIGRRLVGQTEIATSVVSALLAGGHVLIEGVPGLGKTLLVRTLAQALELTFSRVQFTPDLMPADVIGTNLIVEDAGGRRPTGCSGQGARARPRRPPRGSTRPRARARASRPQCARPVRDSNTA